MVGLSQLRGCADVYKMQMKMLPDGRDVRSSLTWAKEGVRRNGGCIRGVFKTEESVRSNLSKGKCVIPVLI